MKVAKLFVWVFMVVCFSVGAKDDILFLAHFNQGLEPDIAKEPAVAASANVEINANAGFRFKKSIKSAAGLDLTKRGSFVAYSAAGNFNPSQGTVQFWFKPSKWIMEPRDRYSFARIFALVFDTDKRGKLEQEGGVGGLAITKAEKAWELDLRNFKSWKDTKITADVSSWNNEEWHQLAVTWQEKGNKILYIDGAKVSEGVYH